MKKSLLFLLIITAAFTSCKKYEDDGFISLRTAKARLTGTWKAEKAFDKDGNDISSTLTSTNYQVRFDKDGKFNVTANVLIFTLNATGKWEFIESKQSIKITMDPNQFGLENSTWKIKKLHGGELHVINNDGEIHFTEVK
jgi:uncharacterized protein YfcZ (UPF0381/DUF406 family)